MGFVSCRFDLSVELVILEGRAESFFGELFVAVQGYVH